MTIKNASPKTAAVQDRLTSTVRREVHDGQSVYVKEFKGSDWDSCPQTIIERAKREKEVIRALAGISQLRGRLGCVLLSDASNDERTIATHEAPGVPLDEILNSADRFSFSCLRAVYLAGHWLNAFQTLECAPEKIASIGQFSPIDMREYCDIRLKTMQNLGYRWITVERRRRILDAVDRLLTRTSDVENEKVWSHCDYGPGNVLWDSHTLTAIDFAMACCEVPLLDVTYFIHRMEMLAIYFPWKRWPLDFWRRAFLRGYGSPDAEQSPMYRALMIRHVICRLQTYIRRPPNNLKQQLHNKWVRGCLRHRLERLVALA